MNSNKALWANILDELKNNISKRLFDLWFKDTCIVSYNQELLQIQVPNQIIKQKISEKCFEELGKAIAKCCGHQPAVEFIIREEQQALFDFEENTSEKMVVEVEETPLPPPNLNPHYTFSNFVVGPSNQLAHAAALAVAKGPGKTYNPLFMYGAVGLGKTHLLQAICHELLGRDYQQSIVYLSCEEFINEFITAVEQGDLTGFRYRYRHVSLLLIDDIHFLASKERTQEEFFHTFNTLYNSNKQLILSSDSSPAEIPEIKERLVSRFKWGLVTQLNVPSFETRVAIVKKKSKLKGRELPDDVCQYISEHISTNIRELEGAVNHLAAMTSLHNKEKISLEFARFALRDIIDFQEPEIDFSELVDVVAEHFQVKISELKSKKRHKGIVVPRQIAMYLARQLCKSSFQEIGGFFGGRDHTTVLHAIDKVNDNKSKDPSFVKTLKDLEKKIIDKRF